MENLLKTFKLYLRVILVKYLKKYKPKFSSLCR